MVVVVVVEEPAESVSSCCWSSRNRYKPRVQASVSCCACVRACDTSDCIPSSRCNKVTFSASSPSALRCCTVDVPAIVRARLREHAAVRGRTISCIERLDHSCLEFGDTSFCLLQAAHDFLACFCSICIGASEWVRTTMTTTTTSGTSHNEIDSDWGHCK